MGVAPDLAWDWKVGAHASMSIRPVAREPRAGGGTQGRRFLEVYSLLTAHPRCGARASDTRHARTCPRAGSQVNQRQPPRHTMSRVLDRPAIAHTVEDSTPLLARKTS